MGMLWRMFTAIFYFGTLMTLIQAHMRFVCPRPESGNSGIKSGPCSDEGNAFDAIYTDITPGPLTLRFEETIFHKGAPTRLTLNKYGDTENVCMLLDQVPHNEAGTMNIGPDCWPFDWPVGKCMSQHYVTVNIPDIECERCYIQLVSVMTDKYKDDELPCWQESQAKNNCSSYFSCANVKIRPTTAGKGKDIDTCTDYEKNRVGEWPYLPKYDAEKFSRDYYRRHGINFTEVGWMQGEEFVGGAATYPFAVQPQGLCIPETQYYGGFAVTEDGAAFNAVFTLTLSENHGWVRGAVLGAQIKSIRLYRSDGEVAPLDLPYSGISTDETLYNAMVDVKEAVTSDSLYDMVTIVGKTGSKEVNMTLKTAVTTAIMSGREHKGEALFRLEPHAELKYLVLYSSESSEVTGLSLNGPARQGMEGESLISLNFKTSGDSSIGSDSVESFGIVGLDGLHSGQLYVDVKTKENAGLGRHTSGQLPPRKLCRDRDNTCFTTVLTAGGRGPDQSKKAVDTSGYATVKVNGNTLEYKITLRDFLKVDKVTSIFLRGTTMAELRLYEGEFEKSDLEDNVQIKQGTLTSPPADFIEDLLHGEVSLTVYTTTYWLEGIYGQLPPVSVIV